MTGPGRLIPALVEQIGLPSRGRAFDRARDCGTRIRYGGPRGPPRLRVARRQLRGVVTCGKLTTHWQGLTLSGTRRIHPKVCRRHLTGRLVHPDRIGVRLRAPAQPDAGLDDRAAMAGDRLDLGKTVGRPLRANGGPPAGSSNAARLKVILFTSCHRAEGRTTLDPDLGTRLSRHPCRTLLVDADLTGPMLAIYSGPAPRGWARRRGRERPGVVRCADRRGRRPPGNLADAKRLTRPRDFLTSPAWTCVLARFAVSTTWSSLTAARSSTASAAVLHRSVDAAVLVHHRSVTGKRDPSAREVLDAGGCHSWVWPRRSSD